MINISLVEFTRRLFSGGGVSFKGILLLPAYYLQMIPALPFTLLQFMFYGRRIKKTSIARDPVFILGHYRCGTTLLQKLLASNKHFGCMTNYDSLFPNTVLLLGSRMQQVLQQVINFLKIKNPFFHNSIVQLSDPCEEDDYLMNKASAYTAYWGLVFPKRWREWLNGEKQFMIPGYADNWKKEYRHVLKYATFRNQGRQLVLKSPPNTERILTLLQLFPESKFIYLYRNPYHLFYSIKNMWKHAILKYYSVQKISDAELDELVFEHLIYLTGQYEKYKKHIPPGNLIEMSYEELIADPFNAVKKIYAQLDIPGFKEAEDDLRHQLAAEKNYRNFEYTANDVVDHKIREKWGPYIQKWNY